MLHLPNHIKYNIMLSSITIFQYTIYIIRVISILFTEDLYSN